LGEGKNGKNEPNNLKKPVSGKKGAMQKRGRLTPSIGSFCFVERRRKGGSERKFRGKRTGQKAR